MTAEEFYKKGNECRRRGEYDKALQYYHEAIALDPDSPAVIAKQMLDEQYAFYYKDLYNP